MSKIRLPPGRWLADSPEPKLPIDPICESAIGKLWVLYKTNSRHPQVVGSGLVVRMWVFGRYIQELREWDDAGCPHVCGRTGKTGDTKARRARGRCAPGGPLPRSTDVVRAGVTLNQCASDATVYFSVSVWDEPGTAGEHLTSAVSFVIPYVAQGVNVTGITLNSFPNINSIKALSNTEPTSGSGNPIWFVADVSDPDGDNFVAQWTDNCGGNFQMGYSATQLDKYWYYPSSLAPGSVCTITLTVTETGNAKTGHNGGTNSASFTLTLAPADLVH